MEMEDALWKEMFFKDNFNVDHCLSKHIFKSDLKTICDDLKHYGNELHLEMAEILKTETEEIVNVAEHLTKLNCYIEDLSLPVSQLREEIKILFDLIKQTKLNFHKSLNLMKTNNGSQTYCLVRDRILQDAKYIENLSTKQDPSDQCVIIERAVNNFSFDYRYLEMSNFSLEGEDIDYINKTLIKMINKVFLNALNNGDANTILRSLRIYDNLGQAAEAEKVYRLFVVRPALQDVFTDRSLEECAQNIGKLYEKALTFIQVHMDILRRLQNENKELASFNFVLNSFWLEVDKQARENLPHIAAPGNPDLFQKRFQTTWKFLEQIAKLSGDPNLLYTNKTFQEHLKRYNLSVYFEIRFQQIASKFENAAIVIYGSDEIYIGHNEINCQLKLTLAYWQSLLLCFNPDIFLHNLADKFIKLSMYLLARYTKWFENALQMSELANDHSEKWQSFLIKSMNDLLIVQVLIGYNGEQSQSFYKPLSGNFNETVSKLRKLNTKNLDAIEVKLQGFLVNKMCAGCLVQLQNVSAIPRLYRRTNRPAPTASSAYMIEAMNPILRLNENLTGAVKCKRESIMSDIVGQITKQYSSLLEKVLQSVFKTEESLRRLKNRNQTTPEETDNPVAMSDEMKIREQIRLDVLYFMSKLKPIVSEETAKAIDILNNHTC